MDLDRMREIVAGIPEGGWMSYGDVARAAGGTDQHARALNQRFIREKTPGSHRVLEVGRDGRRHRARRPGGGPPPARGARGSSSKAAGPARTRGCGPPELVEAA